MSTRTLQRSETPSWETDVTSCDSFVEMGEQHSKLTKTRPSAPSCSGRPRARLSGITAGDSGGPHFRDMERFRNCHPKVTRCLPNSIGLLGIRLEHGSRVSGVPHHYVVGDSFERTPADEHLCPIRSQHVCETVRVAWHPTTRSGSTLKVCPGAHESCRGATRVGSTLWASIDRQNPEASWNSSPPRKTSLWMCQTSANLYEKTSGGQRPPVFARENMHTKGEQRLSSHRVHPWMRESVTTHRRWHRHHTLDWTLRRHWRVGRFSGQFSVPAYLTFASIHATICTTSTNLRQF